MNIRSLFSPKKTQKKEYYAAVSLREKDGELRILEIDENRHIVRALVRKSFGYTNGWVNIVEDIDEVLYLCERETGFEARSILFILYSHLVDQETKSIKKVYYDCIKETVKQLDLRTVGYMEYHEAVSRYYADQEKFPLHSLIVEVDHPSIMTFLYQDGQLVGSEIIQRSNQCAADLEVSLQKLCLEAILPTRIILYESPSLVSDSTPIVSHEWPEELFPQQPTIDVLKPSELENALIHGISWQLFATDTASQAPSRESTPVLPPQQEIYPPDEDVVVVADKPVQEVAPHDTIEQDTDLGALGFVHDGEVRDSSAVSSREDFPRLSERGAGLLSGLSGMLSKFSLPQITIPTSMTGNKRIGIIAIASILLIGGGVFGLLYGLHKAKLTLVYALPVVKETVRLDSPLPVKKAEKEVSAHVSIVTTGSKEVGEKAKGTVTIYNTEEKVQTFTKGTTIRSGSQEFLLDRDVKVASASEQLTSGGDVLTVTGKESSTATAKDIGEEYNVKKDTKFSIGSQSQSSVFAVATNAFSGGSKKKVQAASKEDVAKLRSEADKQLKAELGKALQSDESTGIVDSLTDLSAGKEKFSTDLDKEAKSIDLTKTATATYYTYDKVETKAIVLTALQKSLGSKYDVAKSKVSFKIASAELDGDTVTADLDTSLSPVPVLDIEKVKTDIRGKSLDALDEYVRTNLKASEITLRPVHSLLFLNDRVPFFAKNIEIEVEVK